MSSLDDADQAYADGGRDADLDARILAFRAIRRAAAVARVHDRAANNYANVSHYRVNVAVARERSDAIREAIRAAIGSEKA